MCAVVLAGYGPGTDAPPSVGVESANFNNAGIEFSNRVPILASGTVTAIYVESGDAVTNCRAAIYQNDGTTTLTGRTRLSGDITPPVLGAGAYAGWHKYTVSPGLDILLADAFIWLSFVRVGTVYNYFDFSTTGGTSRDTSGVSTMALTHPTTTNSFANRFNTFAEGTAGVGSSDPGVGGHGAPAGMLDPDLDSRAWF